MMTYFYVINYSIQGDDIVEVDDEDKGKENSNNELWQKN